ncbi:hypothetical protein METHB2_280002 [Candidatus Methylobacter favarea]|uniref:Uncharacterized protein n=1 Tax=Candidatus Methylobacter favarea TaxID=2707345 RepID=A0A8S0X848_9GAMM|nr:hypothetical protein METHB2_280002 [Candidatus Methylobacter favarea]
MTKDKFIKLQSDVSKQNLFPGRDMKRLEAVKNQLLKHGYHKRPSLIVTSVKPLPEFQ